MKKNITYGNDFVGQFLFLQVTMNSLRVESIEVTSNEAIEMNETFLNKVILRPAISAIRRSGTTENIDRTNVVLFGNVGTTVSSKVKDDSKTIVQFKLLPRSLDSPVEHLEILVVVMRNTLEVREEVEGRVLSTLRLLDTVASVDVVVDVVADEVRGSSFDFIEVGVRVIEKSCVSQRNGSPRFILSLVERLKS